MEEYLAPELLITIIKKNNIPSVSEDQEELEG